MLLLLLSLVVARAEEPAAPRPYESPFGDVLEEAKRQYFAGDPTDAEQMLQALRLRLEAGEQVDPDQAAEAITYLGEIQLLALGDKDRADETFRWLLTRHPDQPINTYHHPAEVVAEFETQRRAVEDEIEQRQRQQQELVAHAKLPAVPVWGYVPFGVPQLAQGRTVPGVVYAGAEVGLAAVSVGMLAHRSAENRHWPAGTDAELDRYAQHMQQERYLVQWPATFGFYALWAASVAGGRAQWRAHAIEQITATPIDGGGSVEVHGRF